MIAKTLSLALKGLVIASLLGTMPPPRALAAGVVGTGTPASCTEAALDAALAGGGTVTFDCGAAPHTITLTSYKQISIDTELLGGGLITLSGDDTTSLFQVFTDKTLSLWDITLRQGNGTVTSGFGAIQNFGTLNLTNSQLISNMSPTSGGAIENRGRLNLTNSVIAGNTASQSGGGIYSDGGSVSIQGSAIYSNTSSLGGGIGVHGNSSITITLTTLHDNLSNGQGGGMYIAGTATLTNVVFSRNIANISGGGLYNDGRITLAHVAFSLNEAETGSGGGLSSPVSNPGALTLTDVAFSNNTAESNGGGLFSYGAATLTNVTFSGNTTESNGGGLFLSVTSLDLSTLTNITFSENAANASGGGLHINNGRVHLTHSTFSGNIAGISGGGIYLSSSGILEVRASIVANNPSGGNCFGAVTNNGFNLATDATCTGFNQVADVLLGPLADNGGFTQTHLPQPGSPAIDLVTVGCPPPATDQRGVNRPEDGDGNGSAACDVGAVEVLPIVSKLVPWVYLPLLIR